MQRSDHPAGNSPARGANFRKIPASWGTAERIARVMEQIPAVKEALDRQDKEKS